MKKIRKLVVLISLILFSGSIIASDKLIELNFDTAIQSGYEQGILDKNIQFKLSGQKHAEVKEIISDVKTNKKTRGAFKSGKKSCDWVLLSALKTLQNKAISLNANAIINIKSNYKKHEYVSDTNYQCGRGLLMSGVALKGQIAILK